MEECFVYFSVRAEFLNVIYSGFRFKALMNILWIMEEQMFRGLACAGKTIKFRLNG